MGRRPKAIKNHFALEISLSRTQETSLRPKNLPPRSHNFHQSAKKKKLQGRTQRPDSRSGCGLSAAKTLRRPEPPSGGGCGAGWATPAPESSGSGGALPARSDAGTAPASAPLPTTASSGRRDQRKRGTMLGRAGGSARSTGLQHPFRPGLPAAAPSLLLGPPFTAGAEKRWPLTSPRLATTAFLPARRLPESARRRRARGEAGARREGGAHEGSRARGGARRAALPEDPLPLRRVFG